MLHGTPEIIYCIRTGSDSLLVGGSLFIWKGPFMPVSFWQHVCRRGAALPLAEGGGHGFGF